MTRVNDSNFWEQRYKEQSIPWDIGKAAPAFIKHFQPKATNPLFSIVPKSSLAVIGCGRGHDAFFIAENNKECEVHAFDFSESAINHCNEVKKKHKFENIYFYQIDIFTLIKEKKWASYFDYVIEHTCFCAIEPERRNEYIELIKYLLKPNGKLAGLFFIRPKEIKGPPFGSTPEEIKNYFKKGFEEIEELHFEPCLHDNLQGEEWFGIFKLKSSDLF